MIDLNSLRECDDYIVTDSIKVIQKILKHSKLSPYHLYIREDLREQIDISKFQNLTEMTAYEFKSIKGEKFHKGAIGVFERPKFVNANDIKGPFAILNGVTSPENVGSIVRTLAGLNFKSLIIDEKSCSPLVRRAIRVSMGNFIFLDIARTKDLKEFLKETRLEIYATANEKEAISLYDWEPNKNCGFIIGSEGHGISKDLIPLCKGTLKIPIRDDVQHLNASNASAIVASWIHSKTIIQS